MKLILSVFGILLNSIIVQSQRTVHIQEYTHDSINVRLDAPFALAETELHIPSKGKVIARMEGDCISSMGDVITFGVSNTSFWYTNYGNLGVRLFDSIRNNNRYFHTMSFDVEPGKSSFYAYAHNWTDKNGTGIISVKGRFILEFIPDIEDENSHTYKNMSIFPFNINENAKLVDSISIKTSRPAKILFTFNGRFYSRKDTEVEIVLNDTESMEDIEDSFHLYVPDSKYLPAFSKQIVRNVPAGEHQFFVMTRKIKGNMDDLENAFYATLNATVFYDDSHKESVSIEKSEKIIPPNGAISNLATLEWKVPDKGKILVSCVGFAEMDFNQSLDLNLNFSAMGETKSDIINLQPNHPEERQSFYTIHKIYSVEKGDIQINLDALLTGGDTQNKISIDLVLKFIADPVVSSVTQYDNEQLQVKIYPNPASKFLNIKWSDSELSETTEVRIMDYSGNPVKSFHMSKTPEYILNIDDLNDGIYFLEIRNGIQREIFKFIKIN